jgi:hypothetical protein
MKVYSTVRSQRSTEIRFSMGLSFLEERGVHADPVDQALERR